MPPMRHTIAVAGLEFEDGGNTIWVHGKGGTVLRIKTDGKVTSKACSVELAGYAHADVAAHGDIEICVSVPRTRRRTASRGRESGQRDSLPEPRDSHAAGARRKARSRR